ncbi:biotin transport system substrate-specific component [Bacillus pakistanensis]|uniref:Biotin transporter n=1 Tax=Rossellomorea pakistanensis TaxID=992288 RepID=A0ABS2NJP2_9BACI|nr:biotin transporter BioY [Bacillus pakistanensis]MBM7587741.1 biotin transport system substrate-specific component [Bacillus pakistanensis]
MTKEKSKLRMMIQCGIFAAITAVLAQVEVPLPLVPISGQTLAVGLTATILGSRYGALAMVCYAALGAVGLPVFAGLKGGAQVLVGPTGGYIFGFIATAFVTGLILERTKYNLTMAMIANTAGMIITLLFGTIQLKFVLDLTWGQALAGGVYPFIAVGLIKAFLASWIGITVRSRLIQAKLLSGGKKVAA